MKLLATIFALTLLVCTAHAQAPVFTPKPMHHFHPYPDSIRIEFQDQGSLMIFQFKSPDKAGDRIENFFNALPMLLKTFEESISDHTTTRKMDVNVIQDKENEITIQASDNTRTRVWMKDGGIQELRPPGWEIYFHSKDDQIYVYAQTFEQLKAIAAFNREPIVLQLNSAAKFPHGRKRVVARIIASKDKIVFNDVQWQMPEDFLVGTASTGLGLLGDKFYPELNATITIRKNDHFNRAKHRFALTYNNLFFMERRTDGGYKLNTNSFLTVGWSGNIDGSGTFLGVGAGYLIYRSGDYFKGKTAKFYISKDFGGFNLAPEFYLTNDFKDLQMGIRLRYTF